MAKFELGRVVETIGINQKEMADGYFKAFIGLSLLRYAQCDWGDICEEDAESNDYAVEHGERILAAYIFDFEDVLNGLEAISSDSYWKPKKTEEKNSDEVKIWIITEWDRSVTTILFPDEY